MTEDQLRDTPSKASGLDSETETSLHFYGCNLIAKAGVLLDLPYNVNCTAQVLFHRFYCMKSFANYNLKQISMSCLWLACKLDEIPQKIDMFFTVFHGLNTHEKGAHCRQALDAYASEKMKRILAWHEMTILRTFGFVCHVSHPHKFILCILQMLKRSDNDVKALMQEAWNLACDSMRTLLCVRFRSEVVACGVVYFAIKKLKILLSDSPQWWMVFGASLEDIHHVVTVLHEISGRSLHVKQRNSSKANESHDQILLQDTDRTQNRTQNRNDVKGLAADSDRVGPKKEGRNGGAKGYGDQQSFHSASFD